MSGLDSVVVGLEGGSVGVNWTCWREVAVMA